MRSAALWVSVAFFPFLGISAQQDPGAQGPRAQELRSEALDGGGRKRSLIFMVFHRFECI